VTDDPFPLRGEVPDDELPTVSEWLAAGAPLREVEPIPERGGWFNMRCWNGLSAEQQHTLIHVGTLPLGYRPEGTCPRGAEVAIEFETDKASGPRFYCRPCAIVYVSSGLLAGR